MTDADTPRTTGLVDAPEDDSYRLAAIPLSPERFTTWRERLAQWRALRNAPLHPEEPRIRAARLAERSTVTSSAIGASRATAAPLALAAMRPT